MEAEVSATLEAGTWLSLNDVLHVKCSSRHGAGDFLRGGEA